MKTITIQANNSLITEIIAVAQALAKTKGETLNIDTKGDYFDNLNPSSLEVIKKEMNARAEAYYKGTLKTSSFEELKAKSEKW
ncbi:Uncharacterised protein [Campylobacter sputorum subsp. bubulus]|uniref:Uncharacterized protein n=1 Tax=Campylobacter sputorum subsp. sputorum TaxID=32024 RepID=A0A381DKT6_9BACT|nr:hypothetical protein [Campylobacter sputorum]ASM34645.1 hypothetical protein CSPUT_0389 [Campylobacter sputorum aubsp. sputorum RM3237]ASM36308.1 hypothetical protein CSF_0395 [Campylobacter sputorum bv. faecalis CCUG 20703]ASM37988.1 hypothetical protein CSPARA_0385 [Campylobacter sputorum bv. paraureolyticus LMG 11764]KAB0581141.1 hypothetical protein F7P64_07245 [Campylobacter sputorum subsp. sputorum]MDY6121042.1 hypothetical protein [Campylobacter sputorum]